MWLDPSIWYQALGYQIPGTKYLKYLVQSTWYQVGTKRVAVARHELKLCMHGAMPLVIIF